MKISKAQLQEIIVQEYLKEEGILLELTDEEKEEMLAWIRGGARPKWATKDLGTSRAGKAMQSPMDPTVDRSADTMPFPADDMPQYNDEPDEEGAYDTEAEAPETPSDPAAIEDQIAALVQGMPPEEVSDLFQAVFSKIPGVEIGPPEEEESDTLYTPGAEGRPQISLGPLREAVFQKLMEAGGTMYRGLGAAYKRDDSSFIDELDGMSDEDLVDQAERDGIEVHRYLDDDGYIISPEFREKLIDAIKNV